VIDPLPADLPTLPDDDVVETVAVSAEKLGISGSTLRRLIASGSGPATVRLSRRRIGITRGCAGPI
jgi:hypothetical protein